MSILNNEYDKLEEFRVYLSQIGFKVGKDEWAGVIWDIEMINEIPTLIWKADRNIVSRASTAINLNRYAISRVIRDGYRVKLEYDPSYVYGNITLDLCINGVSPERFKEIIGDMPFSNILINVYDCFEFNLKDYFTKKMSVGMVTIVNKDIVTGKDSLHSWCDLTVPSGFWKICSKLVINGMRSIKFGGNVSNYELLNICNQKS